MKEAGNRADPALETNPLCVKLWLQLREKFPFRANDLPALCSPVVGTPPWVMLWISVRSPLRFQTLSKTQRTDQLPARPRQGLKLLLWTPPLILGWSLSSVWCRQEVWRKWQTTECVCSFVLPFSSPPLRFIFAAVSCVFTCFSPTSVLMSFSSFWISAFFRSSVCLSFMYLCHRPRWGRKMFFSLSLLWTSLANMRANSPPADTNTRHIVWDPAASYFPCLFLGF